MCKKCLGLTFRSLTLFESQTLNLPEEFTSKTNKQL